MRDNSVGGVVGGGIGALLASQALLKELVADVEPRRNTAHQT